MLVLGVHLLFISLKGVVHIGDGDLGFGENAHFLLVFLFVTIYYFK